MANKRSKYLYIQPFNNTEESLTVLAQKYGCSIKYHGNKIHVKPVSKQIPDDFEIEIKGNNMIKVFHVNTRRNYSGKLNQGHYEDKWVVSNIEDVFSKIQNHKMPIKMGGHMYHMKDLFVQIEEDRKNSKNRK